MRFYICKSQKRWPTRRTQRWYARIVSENGNEIWRTSELYTNRKDAVAAIRMLRPRAKIEEGL